MLSKLFSLKISDWAMEVRSKRREKQCFVLCSTGSHGEAPAKSCGLKLTSMSHSRSLKNYHSVWEKLRAISPSKLSVYRMAIAGGNRNFTLLLSISLFRYSSKLVHGWQRQRLAYCVPLPYSLLREVLTEIKLEFNLYPLTGACGRRWGFPLLSAGSVGHMLWRTKILQRLNSYLFPSLLKWCYLIKRRQREWLIRNFYFGGIWFSNNDRSASACSCDVGLGGTWNPLRQEERRKVKTISHMMGWHVPVELIHQHHCINHHFFHFTLASSTVNDFFHPLFFFSLLFSFFFRSILP